MRERQRERKRKKERERRSRRIMGEEGRNDDEFKKVRGRLPSRRKRKERRKD